MRRASSKRGRKPRKPPPGQPGPLHYKVAELSTVDEGSLEHLVNTWVAQGWRLETVQFAMRESSKRPAMAFVFFTRAGPVSEATSEASTAHGERPVQDAWARLAALAGEGEEP